MRKKVIISNCILILCIGILCSCGSNTNINSNATTIDKEAIHNDVIQLISLNKKSTELEYISDDIIVANSDALTISDKSNIKTYLADKAYYIQYGKYMYRFQIIDNKVVSYIKYEVIG